MIEVIVTAIKASKDENPHPVVSTHRVTFESEDEYNDWLHFVASKYDATVERMEA